MKAIFETGGKQYYVAEGDVIYVEKLDAEVGSEVKFDKVLLNNCSFSNSIAVISNFLVFSKLYILKKKYANNDNILIKVIITGIVSL